MQIRSISLDAERQGNEDINLTNSHVYWVVELHTCTKDICTACFLSARRMRPSWARVPSYRNACTTRAPRCDVRPHFPPMLMPLVTLVAYHVTDNCLHNIRSGPLQGPSVFLVLGILLIARSRTALFRHMLKTVSPAVSVEVKDRNVRNAFLRWAASGDLRVGIYARLLRKVVKMTVTEGRAVQTCLTEANSDVGRREGHGGGNVDDDPTRATSDLIMLSRALVDQVTARLEVLEPTSRVHPPMTPREEAAAIMRERGRAEGPTRARAAETAARSIAASAPCDCLECAQPAPSVSNGQDYVSNTANTPDEPRQSTRRLTRQSARQPTRHAPPAPGVDEAGQSDLSNGLPAPDHQEESSLPVTIAVPVVMAMSTLTVVQPDEVSERLVVRLLEVTK